MEALFGAGGMPGGLPSGMQANAQQFWKMLDDLSESDPQAYKDFIEKQMASAAQDMKLDEEGGGGQKGTKDEKTKAPPKGAAKRAPAPQPLSSASIIRESKAAESADDAPSLVIPQSTSSNPSPSTSRAPLIQEISSSSSSNTASPSHTLTTEGEGAQRKFVLSAVFEDVEDGTTIDCQVAKKTVSLQAPSGARVEVALAEEVEEDAVKAKWKRKKRTLVVELPIRA